MNEGIALRAALAAALLSLAGGEGRAADLVPRLLTYGGYLVDAEGKPAGATTLTFALYQGQADTVPLWSESVAVTPSEADGYFSAVLGSTVALPRSLAAYWLGITYPGEQEMPRVAVTATPWALEAGSAEGARSLECAGCVGSAQLAAGAVTASNLASGAIGAANLDPPASCAANQALVWSGTEWHCATPAAPSAAALTPPSPCAANQVLTWSGSTWICTAPAAPAPPGLACTPQSAPAGPVGALGGTLSVTVACPMGSFATGGGYTSASPGASITVESHPASSSQWSFFIRNDDLLSGWSGTVYAQCCTTR